MRKPTPQAADAPLAVGEPQAARMLGVSPRTLWTWRKTGQGPHHRKAGGRVLYPIAALHYWLADKPQGGPHDEA